MAKLTIREDGNSTVYEILDDVVSIGRKEGVSVRLRDASVGSEHCQIRNAPGVGYKLIDLESRNGTKVNGQYVNQHVLADGDEIAIGTATITFAGAAPKPAAARPAVAAPARPARRGIRCESEVSRLDVHESRIALEAVLVVAERMLER